jgi:Ca2+-binding RTX toxin-like protein
LASDNAIKIGNGNGDILSAEEGGRNSIILGNGAGDMVKLEEESNDTIALGNGAGDLVNLDFHSNKNNVALGNGARDAVNDSGNNNTITIGNGDDRVFGGADDTITVGNGNDQLFAAPGDFWTVGHGQDVFTFNAGFGDNTITDFNTSHDVLRFDTSLFANYAAVMADTQQVRLNAVITFDSNDSITLSGVQASRLSASNFKFT